MKKEKLDFQLNLRSSHSRSSYTDWPIMVMKQKILHFVASDSGRFWHFSTKYFIMYWYKNIYTTFYETLHAVKSF